MPGISLRDVGLRFRTPEGSLRTIYKDLNLDVEDGSFTVVLGPSGCGKSTLLNIVGGLATGDCLGQVQIGVHQSSPKLTGDAKIGYIFQDARLLPWRTLRKNAEFALRAQQIQPKHRWAELIQKYFDMVGLEDYLEYYPNEVSGGMQQRASIARAWVNEPEILLMDEPFSHLDSITADQLRARLIELWTQDSVRRTVLFVTHNLSEAARLASDVVVLSRAPVEVAYRERIDLPWPRHPDDPAVVATEARLREALSSVSANSSGDAA